MGLASFPLTSHHFGINLRQDLRTARGAGSNPSDLDMYCPAGLAAATPQAGQGRRAPVVVGGGEGWIRTSVRLRGQIYSLLPLTTRPPLQGAGKARHVAADL